MSGAGVNHMVRAKTITATQVCTHNGDGLLVAQSIDRVETAFTWDQALENPQVLATSDGTKSLYGLERLAVLEGGAWHYPQHDAISSVRQWTDAAGAVLATESYSPFGVPRTRLGPAPWGFTGEWHDPGGLVYLRARWYNVALRGFTQVDPFLGMPSSPAMRHPYVYGLNNPLRFIDPMGLFSEQELLGWGFDQAQIDKWKSDWLWWAFLEAAELYDRVTATNPYTSGKPRPVETSFFLLPDDWVECRGPRLQIAGYANLESFRQKTKDRHLYYWESGGWQERGYSTTFLTVPPTVDVLYYDTSAVDWGEVGLDVGGVLTAGLAKWGRVPKVAQTVAEGVNAGISGTQTGLHMGGSDCAPLALDVAGLYPPLAIPAGLVGLGMDLAPGLKVKAVPAF